MTDLCLGLTGLPGRKAAQDPNESRRAFHCAIFLLLVTGVVPKAPTIGFLRGGEK